jgi:MFS family permease
MTYLASISLIQDVTSRYGNTQNANTLVSILILVKLVPNVLFLPIGGILADSYDRRRIQVILNLCNSSVVVVFLWSLANESIFLNLVANFLIETANGLYIPSNEAMLPQLFRGDGKHGEDNLKKANVLYGLSWSLMAAIGASLGGIFVAAFGMNGCFVIDSMTYLISAVILQFGVQGNYNASISPINEEQSDDLSSSKSDEKLSLLELQSENGSENATIDDPKDLNGASTGGLVFFVQGLKFLFVQKPLLGACALLKGSSSLIYGAVDVLNVSFSARGSELDPSRTSLKLGSLFACVGVGCVLGSIITDALSDLSRPRMIARLCVASFACLSVAMFWMAATPDIFESLCLSTVVRAIGSAIVWINSSLLIQKYTPQALLGRVSSFDSGAALLAEALSALGGGMLMDQIGLSAEELSVILGGIGLCFFFIWSPLASRF